MLCLALQADPTAVGTAAFLPGKHCSRASNALFEGLFLASGFHTDKLTSYNTPTSLLNLTGKVKIGRLYNDVYLYIRKSTKKLLS